MMREKTQNIMKMNGLYLEDFLHKNQSYCQVLPEEKKEDNSLPQIEQKQKLYIHNFDYVNDNFRKQLNKAFLLFNPLIHLENLYMLQKADPSIKDDINKLRESVNEDLKEVTDKTYYKKKYEALIKKNRPKRKSSSSSDEKSDTVDKAANTNKRSTGFISRLRQTNPNEVKKRFPKKEIRAKERKLYHIIYS